jgi:D-alanyl-D-alanine carboxypeptidase
VGNGGAEQLNVVVSVALYELFDLAQSEEGGRFFVWSGYRDSVRQKEIYDVAGEDKSYVQAPGHSEHQSGFAVDILDHRIAAVDFTGSQPAQWLADNAWRKGFILRYPEGKQEITKIAYESWHFRYIGQPHAWYCYQNNRSFEEYLQFLRDSDGYRIDYEGVTSDVWYEMPKDGMIAVPSSGNSYTVSSDNTGGYVITARDLEQ